MQVFLKTFKGNTKLLAINPQDRISDLKLLLEKQEGIPIRHQRIIFSGKQLDDNHTMNDYSIKRNSTIQLMLRLQGR